jgi:hypothetical protein
MSLGKRVPTWVVACFWILPASAADQLITWTTNPVVLESAFSSWTRMAQLPDGSWLAAYTYTAPLPFIRVQRSYDNMRTWSWVTDVTEAGRNLDNANLCLRSDGTVLLALLSDIPGSFHINVYSSTDSGNSFQFLSQVDWDHGGLGGLYEPFLYFQPDGSLLCFYSSEIHQNETPAYAQTLSEKVSLDGGQTWGPEILAVAQTGGGRAGEGNIVRIAGTVLGLFYELCGTDNCLGHLIFSSDGVTWNGIGPALPDTFESVVAVEMQNGLLFATSNLTRVIVSPDVGNTWIRVPQWPFLQGSWPGIYQTAPNEIAMVVSGGGDQGQAGQYIRFGTVDVTALPSLMPLSTCTSSSLGKSQNCH